MGFTEDQSRIAYQQMWDDDGAPLGFIGRPIAWTLGAPVIFVARRDVAWASTVTTALEQNRVILIRQEMLMGHVRSELQRVRAQQVPMP